MNVYDVTCDTQTYRAVFSVHFNDLDKIVFRPQGRPFRAEWQPIAFEHAGPSDEDYKPNAIDGDFVGRGVSGICLAPKAVQLVGDLFRPYGELLPLTVNGEPNKLWWFHCTTVVDALDLAKSKVRRLGEKPDGIIVEYLEYAFYAEKIGQNLLFQIPKDRTTLCTEPVKRRIEELGLTGLDFWLVWSDEPEGIEQLKRRKLERMSAASDARH